MPIALPSPPPHRCRSLQAMEGAHAIGSPVGHRIGACHEEGVCHESPSKAEAQAIVLR